MASGLFLALEAVAFTALALVIFRLSRSFALIARVRLALCVAGLLLAVLILERKLGHPAGEAVSTAALAALVLVAVHIFLQLADHVVWERFLKPRRVPVPRLLFDVMNFLVLAGVGFALLKALYAVNLTGLLVTSTVLSAILGLSLQDVLTSVMSGIALQLESPIAVREWIGVGDKEGEIVQMNWRTITVKTRDSHLVVLPNSRVAKEDVVNYSRPDALEVLHAYVSVAYAHSPGDVKAVLAEAAAGAQGVCASPPVRVLLKGFTDSGIEYDVWFWIRDFANVPQIRDAVLSRIWYALGRAGFGIPFPQREVALRNISESFSEQRLEALRRRSLEVLRTVEVFQPLSDEQVEVLARSTRIERYADREYLVRQGEEGRSLFVIKSGIVRVERVEGLGLPREVARLGPGSFFGEMSLLTGEPRTASVIASGEVEVAVVDNAAFATVILPDPRLVLALSEGLERRSREMALSGADHSLQTPFSVDDSGTFFTKIQRFFGLRV